MTDKPYAFRFKDAKLRERFETYRAQHGLNVGRAAEYLIALGLDGWDGGVSGSAPEGPSHPPHRATVVVGARENGRLTTTVAVPDTSREAALSRDRAEKEFARRMGFTGKAKK